jgi:hypothetical protein
MPEHHVASKSKFGPVDFRSQLPEWQVEILTKVTPCGYFSVQCECSSGVSLALVAALRTRSFSVRCECCSKDYFKRAAVFLSLSLVLHEDILVRLGGIVSCRL